MSCDCYWCTRCGLPIMAGWVIAGYCMKPRGHDGGHKRD